MSDNLTFNLAAGGYNVAKYMVYGPVTDVLPYLVRRAQENTSVTGEMGRELRLLGPSGTAQGRALTAQGEAGPRRAGLWILLEEGSDRPDPSRPDAWAQRDGIASSVPGAT